MNAADVKLLANERALDVAMHLLPRGRRNGAEWVCGDVQGSPGDSLRVHIEGPKSGVWCDFAQGGRGSSSLIDLWMAVRGLEFRRAVVELKAFLGVRDEGSSLVRGRGVRQVSGTVQRAGRPPQAQQQGCKPQRVDWQRVHEGSAAWAYLVDERKIRPDVLSAYGVGERPADEYDVSKRGVEPGDTVIAFPYLDDRGAVGMVKYLAVRRPGGKKLMWVQAGGRKIAFGRQACDPARAKLVVCEGEIEALTWASIGEPAISVPFGAKHRAADGRDPNDEWIDAEWDWLELWDDLVLAMDADEEGELAQRSLLARFGPERCRLLALPDGHKDANSALQAGLVDALVDAFCAAAPCDPPELRNASSYRVDVWDSLHPPGGVEPGHEFLFPIPFRVRPGELTIWTGFSGHGKTQLLGHLMVHLAARGLARVCIASLEVKPALTLQNLLRQASGTREWTEDCRREFDQAMDWFGERFWLYDHVGIVNWRELIRTMVYAHRRYRIGQFVVDSLLRCGIGTDDYDGQKAFVDALCTFVNDTGAHVHLVAHSKKKEDESKHPSKLDVKGTSEITDMCWNGITVWRNKKKEERLADPETDDEDREYLERSPDAMFFMWKQRNGDGSEPVKRLWFCRQSWQFRTEPNQRPLVYLPGIGR